MPTYLNESDVFSDHVVAIKTSDAVLGTDGVDPNDGIVNAPHVALANRTRSLANELNAIKNQTFLDPLVHFIARGASYIGHGSGIYYPPNYLDVIEELDIPTTNNPFHMAINKLLLRKPHGFSKLNYSFIGHATSGGGLNGTRVALAGNNGWVFWVTKKVDWYQEEVVLRRSVHGSELADAGVRTGQVDLSSFSDGDPVKITLHFRIANPSSFELNYPLYGGRLEISWSV